MISSPLIYIIILNWNGWRDTLACLESIHKFNYANYHVLVIDNGSTDNSVKQIKNWAVDQIGSVDFMDSTSLQLPMGEGTVFKFTVTLLKNQFSLIAYHENLGFSGGCNLGITYALHQDANYIFLLNNDALLEADTLGCLVSVAQKANAAIAGARVMDAQGQHVLFAGSHWPNQLFFSSIVKNYDEHLEFWDSPDAQGCAFLIHCRLLQQRVRDKGYFLDPDLFMYKEETDLCIYSQQKGERCVIVRDAVIYHELSKSSQSYRSYYYLTRNRIYLANRWLSLPMKICFHIYYTPSRYLLLLVKLWRKRLDSRCAGAIISGLADGYRGIKGKWAHH